MSDEDDAPYWGFQTISVMGDTAPSIALEGLDGALTRLQHLSEDRTKIRPAFVALTEGTWWVAALDEHITKRLSPANIHLYKTARDKDEHGKYIRGFLWARDRHTHQLLVSMDRDETPFFGTEIFHISSGFRWRPSSELYEPKESRSRPEWRKVYDELLAGHAAWKTLTRCSRWFHEMAGHNSR